MSPTRQRRAHVYSVISNAIQSRRRRQLNRAAIMRRFDCLAGDFQVFGGIKSICRFHHGMAGALETAP
ncbi:hypothetical protein [Rhodoblastus acidophilus]|uniref:hypothetical protein n=1 Tax=Rhodoblastus acidophilus TaxID=1074 RepID=UPI001130D12E|nr:hypothetical protein [Rhodoblastus acidophilus]